MARRIAIIEDDAAIRANYAEALKRHGYEVSAYAARREAMEAFRLRLPDLAIIDIGLGDEAEGGFALCRDLRSLSPLTPIVFLTARDSDFDVVSGLRNAGKAELPRLVLLLLRQFAGECRDVDTGISAGLEGAPVPGRRSPPTSSSSDRGR